VKYLVNGYLITEDIRERARARAAKRMEIDERLGFKSKLFDEESLGDFDAHFTGAIGEIELETVYPSAIFCQLPTESPSLALLKGHDFLLFGYRVELKCKPLPDWAETYFINKRVHDERGANYDVYVCSSIDGPPATAKYWRLFGWVKSKDIVQYHVTESPSVKSPAYEIPLQDLKPLKALRTSPRPTSPDW